MANVAASPITNAVAMVRPRPACIRRNATAQSIIAASAAAAGRLVAAPSTAGHFSTSRPMKSPHSRETRNPLARQAAHGIAPCWRRGDARSAQTSRSRAGGRSRRRHRGWRRPSPCGLAVTPFDPQPGQRHHSERDDRRELRPSGQRQPGGDEDHASTGSRQSGKDQRRGEHRQVVVVDHAADHRCLRERRRHEREDDASRVGRKQPPAGERARGRARPPTSRRWQGAVSEPKVRGRRKEARAPDSRAAGAECSTSRVRPSGKARKQRSARCDGPGTGSAPPAASG